MTDKFFGTEEGLEVWACLVQLSQEEKENSPNGVTEEPDRFLLFLIHSPKNKNDG